MLELFILDGRCELLLVCSVPPVPLLVRSLRASLAGIAPATFCYRFDAGRRDDNICPITVHTEPRNAVPGRGSSPEAAAALGGCIAGNISCEFVIGRIHILT